MKRPFSIALLVAISGFVSQATATEVDMSKLTCKEVGGMSAAKAVAVAMWMNGYVHGKAGNPKVDGDRAEANAAKIAAYCKENQNATLASALEAVAAK
jgi:acid stress chaperone HdeB